MSLSGPGVSSAPVALDIDFKILDDLDPTKTLQFQVSGLTAGQTRTITAPDSDGTMHTSGADNLTTLNVGTAGTNVTAVEYGNGQSHITELTLASVAYTIGDTATLAIGAIIYTLPAGVCVVNSAAMSMGLTLTTGTPTTDTPDGGIGTLIGSGANATLSAVGAAAPPTRTQRSVRGTGASSRAARSRRRPVGTSETTVIPSSMMARATADASKPWCSTTVVP